MFLGLVLAGHHPINFWLLSKYAEKKLYKSGVTTPIKTAQMLSPWLTFFLSKTSNMNNYCRTNGKTAELLRGQGPLQLKKWQYVNKKITHDSEDPNVGIRIPEKQCQRHENSVPFVTISLEILRSYD